MSVRYKPKGDAYSFYHLLPDSSNNKSSIVKSLFKSESNISFLAYLRHV